MTDRIQIEFDPAAVRAEARKREAADSAIQAKACNLLKKYGLFLPGPAKDFFRELADHLNWTTLKGML